MFLGTIEPVVRNFLAAHVQAFKGRKVAVGCSGNFTSERVLWEATGHDIDLYSNDVSLYTSLIGAHLAGQAFDLSIREPAYQFLLEYFEQGGWVRIAAFLCFYRALAFERQRSVYEKRMWQEYRARFPDLVNGTVKKLEKNTLKIADYFAGDIFDHFKQMDERYGDEVIYTSYMPFFKGGYEHLYRRLGEVFTWNSPTYPMLDDERRLEITAWCLEHNNVTLLDFALPDRQPVMVGHTRRNKHVYLYSNVLDRTALYRRLHPDPGIRLQLWGERDQITPDTVCKLTPVKPQIIQPYKGMFLARNIDYSTGMYGFAVSLNSKVIGFLEYSLGQSGGQGEDWYLFGDFAVGWQFNKRASKLIAMLALCDDVRRSLELKSLRRRKHVTTTAWTEKPVSMKYRGIFDLVKRDESRGMLNYRGTWNGLNAQETFHLWQKKYAKG